MSDETPFRPKINGTGEGLPFDIIELTPEQAACLRSIFKQLPPDPSQVAFDKWCSDNGDRDGRGYIGIAESDEYNRRMFILHKWEYCGGYRLDDGTPYEVYRKDFFGKR